MTVLSSNYEEGPTTCQPSRPQCPVYLLADVCRIVAAQVSDSGTYLCVAKNSLGSILTVTELAVQGTWTLSGWLRGPVV